MPRPDVSDKRIPQILDSAARIFSQHGIDGASMMQVADASGISKATIYHYFDSKDALILALVQRLFEADQPQLERIAADNAPASNRLQAYTNELAILLERNHGVVAIITEVYARAARMEAIRPVIRAYFDSYIRALGTVIQQGIERGELRESANAREIALAFVSLIEGAILIAPHTDQSLEVVMSTTVNVFLEGLKQ